MAARRGARLFCVSRCANQQRSIGSIPLRGGACMVPGAAAPRPAQPTHVDANLRTRRSMATSRPCPAPLARGTLRRQHPTQEPSAVIPPAGIRAGGGPSPRGEGPSLPRPDERRKCASIEFRHMTRFHDGELALVRERGRVLDGEPRSLATGLATAKRSCRNRWAKEGDPSGSLFNLRPGGAGEGRGVSGVGATTINWRSDA